MRTELHSVDVQRTDPDRPPVAVVEPDVITGRQKAIFAGIGLIGAIAWAMIAIVRGESVNAVLYGHHFAAIAGAGPLVGPVLAAQMGYLPGHAVDHRRRGLRRRGAGLHGAVHLDAPDGRSLGDMIKSELGRCPAGHRLFGDLHDHGHHPRGAGADRRQGAGRSPWGTFTVMATIPIALFMGVYLRYIRPGKIGEISVIGFVLLMLAIVLRRPTSPQPDLGPDLHLRRVRS
jgi:carbon starvation protein